MDTAATKKWTRHLHQVVHRATELASAMRVPHALPGHLLLAIAYAPGSLGAAILKRSKFDLVAFEEYMHVQGTNEPPATLSPFAQQLLLHATTLAYHMEHTHIGTEHLLMAMVKYPSPDILTFAETTGWQIQSIEQQVSLILKSNAKLAELTETFFDENDLDEEDNDADIPTTLLNLGIHLTNPQRIKTLDPVIGRDRELERMMQILTRRTKNNPVLLGEPGVGKTALVEALAQRIHLGNVPHELLGKKIVTLEVGSLVAGTMYRGEFEQRIKTMLDELADRNDIIVFIDELHTIVGAGAANGSVDAANLLKPALARGHLRCIGATTLSEYRKYIENDGALERRFQPVTVNEPSAELTRSMLAGLRTRYEQHHQVTLSDEVLDLAVQLSERHLPDRFLPDKAIDLMDEAAAIVKINTPTPPAAVKLHQLETKLREAHRKKEQATKKEDFANALIWKQRTEALHQEIAEIRDQLNTDKAKRPSVTAKAIATVLTNWTGIPIASHQQAERERLSALEERLGKAIYGQPGAVATVSHVLRRARMGLSSERRPLASFLFVGPSGVGKTSLAKAIAKELFGDERALLQLDMTEYSEGYSVSKLLGAPAGYVGYRESGLLTEQVRKKPYQVILFDELDRAHRDISNLLLQLLDEGALRDSSGKLINFKQTIVIATSNPNRHGGTMLGFNNGEKTDSFTLESTTELFPTELRERFDAVIPFQVLTPTALSDIIDAELRTLNERLAHFGTTLNIDQSVRKELLAQNSEQGARKLRQQFTERVERAISEKLSVSKRKKTNYQLSVTKQGWRIT